MKWLSEAVFLLAKWVNQEVEAFKIYLDARELERKIGRNLALLGELMFKQRKQEISSITELPLKSTPLGCNEDQSISSLIYKIREDKNIMSDINKQNNSYLLNRYIFISKLFLHLF